MYGLKRRYALAISCLLFVALLMVPAMARALTIGGTEIIAIDGDLDPGVEVEVGTLALTAGYTYGYYVNLDPTFHVLGGWTQTIFQGGDIIDFALDDGAGNIYTLSGDAADNTYTVEMAFGTEVKIGTPEQPASWTSPYYYSVDITWYLNNTVNTTELAMNNTDGNDGLAPVAIPEPSTLLLLGSGLLGLGFVRRRFR